MNKKLEEKVRLINKPLRWKIDKVKEMNAIYLQNQTKNKAFFLDLDGTIAEYITGTRKHRRIQFRPYFHYFVSELAKICDIYLYSFTDPILIKSLWPKYFKKDFSGVFDCPYWFSHKKSIRAFREWNTNY